jgi:hypothetical protein
MRLKVESRRFQAVGQQLESNLHCPTPPPAPATQPALPGVVVRYKLHLKKQRLETIFSTS